MMELRFEFAFDGGEEKHGGVAEGFIYFLRHFAN